LLEVTVTKDSLPYTTYSFGTLTQSGAWFYGSCGMWFSDRYTGTQNFSGGVNYSLTEHMDLWLSPAGELWIWNEKYQYWIVSGFDMSCMGGLVTSNVPGLGVLTVAIRQWQDTPCH
jgi:hypothetical protein